MNQKEKKKEARRRWRVCWGEEAKEKKEEEEKTDLSLGDNEVEKGTNDHTGQAPVIALMVSDGNSVHMEAGLFKEGSGSGTVCRDVFLL